MKIDVHTLATAASQPKKTPPTDTSASPASQGAAAATTPSTASGVKLSARSTSLLASSQDASQDIDEAKVAQIRQAIADGTLTINPAKIADGLLSTVGELLGAKAA